MLQEIYEEHEEISKNCDELMDKRKSPDAKDIDDIQARWLQENGEKGQC